MTRKPRPAGAARAEAHDPRRASSGGVESGEQTRAPRPDSYVLRLYVAGLTTRSARAIERVREVCEERLSGRYELDVIDIYQLPALARGEQIVATPTLIQVLPLPLRRYIGDLSREKLIFGLDLREKRP